MNYKDNSKSSSVRGITSSEECSESPLQALESTTETLIQDAMLFMDTVLKIREETKCCLDTAPTFKLSEEDLQNIKQKIYDDWVLEMTDIEN